MTHEIDENPKSEKQPIDHLKLEIQIEELEAIVAPAIVRNSNEMLVSDLTEE